MADLIARSLAKQNNAKIDSLTNKGYTLIALRAANLNGLKDGDMVFTNGYYAAGDGGEGSYIMDSTYAGTYDGGDYVNVNGITLRLLHSGTIDVKQFGARNGSDNGVDFTNALKKIKDYAVAKNKKIRCYIPFERTAYYLRESLVVDQHYINIHSHGATIDVTKCIDDNLPYIFNMKYNSASIGNVTERAKITKVISGLFFNSSYTTLSSLATKDTVLFAYEVPTAEASTHSSAMMDMENVGIRNVPYFFSFGRNAYLNNFYSVSGRICRSAIKVYGWNDPTPLNNTADGSGRYHDNWGENITFFGGMFGGSSEDTIYNSMAIGSLNFIGVSIDYSYGGTFLTAKSGALTVFQDSFIEHNHISYNQERPSIKYLVLANDDSITHFDNCFFHLGATADRDNANASLEYFVYSTSGLPNMSIEGSRFSNYKAKVQFAHENVTINMSKNEYFDTLPFIINKRMNLFRTIQPESSATKIEFFPDIYSPYFGTLATEITSQWVNKDAEITWDSTEKAFKVKKIGGSPSANLIVRLQGTTDNYNLGFKAKLITGSGTINAKLRYMTDKSKYLLKADNSILAYPDATDSVYIRSVQDNATLTTSYTSFVDGFVLPRPHYDFLVLNIELANLAVGTEFYIKDIVFNKA